MLELRVTGDTPKEFVTNLLQAVNLVVNGARNTPAPNVVAEAQRDAANLGVSAATGREAEPMENPSANAAPLELVKPKRGRPPTKKAAEQIDAAPPKPEVHDDPLPDDMANKPASVTTLDDCLNAVRAVYENFEKRARAAGETDETKIMNGKIQYAKQLVYGFDVVKVKDLKPEQYFGFVSAAQGYIGGETKLKASA